MNRCNGKDYKSPSAVGSAVMNGVASHEDGVARDEAAGHEIRERDLWSGSVRRTLSGPGRHGNWRHGAGLLPGRWQRQVRCFKAPVAWLPGRTLRSVDYG